MQLFKASKSYFEAFFCFILALRYLSKKMKAGLTTEEANQRLSKFGYNVLPESKSKNIIQIVVEVIKEPMFILIISCGILYIIIGDLREGIVMLSTMSIIIFITFYQYLKTEKALDALKKLASPRVTVIRDAVQQIIDSKSIVVDDIIILQEGDRICADAEVLEAVNLSVDESMLSGESISVKKDPANIVYSGTLVVQGKGIVKVKSTGIDAELGKIALSIKKIEVGKTRFQIELQKLIRKFVFVAIAICISIVLLFYFTRGNLLQSLLNGLASAMAILPEEFPVVLTIFLALGAWRLSTKNVLTRKASAIETLGSATVLCSDKTGTITQNKMEVVAIYNGTDLVLKEFFHQKIELLSNLISHVFYATQLKSIDPTDKAIEELGFILLPDLLNHKLLKEYPLSKELLAMTRVLEIEIDEAPIISTKGAPETIFNLCNLSAVEIAKHSEILHQLASKGYRVLGVANASCNKAELPNQQHHFDFNFLGLIALQDPIRTEVPLAIEECKRAGVKVVMITGDYPETARSIANQIGLSTVNAILSGRELSEMSDEELKNKINTVNVFARILPEQKLRIVKILKSKGEVVAMTGDGVNDAPALKAADIGIAMGMKGTEVAREASSLILLDDNFASIVSAIRLGRRIYDNIQKAMSYILAIHIPIIGLAMLPAFLPSIPILLLPLHIIFMELIIDPVCSIAFETEEEETQIMNRPPRPIQNKFFGTRQVIISIIQGMLLLFMVLIVYYFTVKEGHKETEVRAIVFSALIIGNIFLVSSKLSKTRSFMAIFTEKNYPVIIILTVGIVLMSLSLYIAPIQTIFKFDSPGFFHFLPTFIASFILLFILESMKFYSQIKRFKQKNNQK
jgi:Ca2+-transporting ATPase